MGTHWVVIYVQNNNNNLICFDSFGVEHIPKKIDSIMFGYFCTGFIGFMLAGKTLTEYTNLFSSNNFKKNDDIILNYFMSNI